MTTLPTRFSDEDQRTIQGTILRCVDGRWTSRDGETLDASDTFLVLGTTQALQCWQGGKPVDTVRAEPGKPLPDVHSLNAQVPKKEWEAGMDGSPRPPWVHQHIAYLLRPTDASMFTFINATVGAAIAVGKLGDKVRSMRMLRGDNVVPLVRLDSRPMTTKFGTKQRPEFTIVDWRELGGDGALQNAPVRQIEHKASVAGAQVGGAVKPVTYGEELDDEIPAFGQ